LPADVAIEGTGEHVGAPPPAGSTVGVADGLFVAYGQLMAAASPAAREYGPAVLGLHSFPEPVRFCALAIIWLKCPFRHSGLVCARNAQCEGASPVGLILSNPV